MPDTPMCANTDCPLKNKCYRSTATPDMMQAYTHFKLNADGICDFYKEQVK